MAFPLLSVIVPVYKVEPWLERCVDSIRNQTYTNLEIVLVDDGSPDKCGEICDRIALEDDRIKVIHRENGGLSAARNTGIDFCHGEYIGFVDSDDVIHPEMYSRLYQDISKHGVLLAFCQPFVCKDSPSSFPEVSAPEKCLSSQEVIRKSLSESIWFSAWTKLYHRSLFDGIRYPEGRINEDYPVTMRIYSRCDRIVVDYNKLYAYCKRGGSITTSPVSEKSFDQVVSAEEAYLFVRETHPDCSVLAARILMSSCIGLLLRTDGVLSKKFAAKREGVFEVIQKYYPEERRDLHLRRQQMILLAAANSGKVVYAIVSKIYKALKSAGIR
ncbi:MAG: glycosyltransferase [Bacteroidales bacterium]|nr:glycosyltransferase [Bacteroidales bacterium]